VSDWGERAEAWALHWTRLSAPARTAVAEAAGIGAGTRVLDAGCGSGEFCAQALALGARVSGIDASDGMLALARRRAPEADLRVGDIARLPYEDDAFDVVTAFNAVQFTDDIPAAIAELARVGRTLAICNWGGKRDLSVMFNAVSEPSPQSAALPRLSEPGVLEELIQDAGLTPRHAGDVPTPYETPDLATLVAALRDGSGFELATEDRVREAAAPYRRADGSYRFENRFRYVVATRS
jgi:SAM-dependent methyltransferase